MVSHNIKPVGRNSGIVVQELPSEVLIYDLTANKAFSLNQTSAMIWHLCNGDNTVSDITANLSGRLNFPLSEDFVRLGLDCLKDNNLLENSADMQSNFTGLTRRAAIRRVGFASLVALPLVLSLIAPTALHAASPPPPTCGGNCRCPNATVASCNGSTVTVGGIPYMNCFTTSGNNPACNCTGPFNANDSAGAGFKSSVGGCKLT